MFFTENKQNVIIIIIIPDTTQLKWLYQVFQKVKVTLEMICRVYQVIYWAHQSEKRKKNIQGISRICDNRLPYP